MPTDIADDSTTETMRALISGRGPEWAVAEVPVPQPGPGQVLIRNRASATNNADLPMLAEADPTSGGHGDEFVAGFEYAGEIAALGPDSGDWKVGDPVMGTFRRRSPTSWSPTTATCCRVPSHWAPRSRARCPPHCSPSSAR